MVEGRPLKNDDKCKMNFLVRSFVVGWCNNVSKFYFVGNLHLSYLNIFFSLFYGEWSLMIIVNLTSK